jgi:hypothetical protein
MRNALLAAVATIAILASGALAAQTFSNGPYYAVPSWDQSIPSAQRFIVLSNFNNQAVLDRETGLVWERSPSGSASWNQISFSCLQTTTGNRTGWRAPTVSELSSLLDLTQSNPALPAGNPFQQVMSNHDGQYWSANPSIGPANFSWFVTFAVPPSGFSHISIGAQSGSGGIWCVRGASSDTNPQ